MLYDAFICHVSEDKDDVARPLANRLREKRVEVWYDEFSLAAGMSLRQSIDLGLAKSRFGIVVLSPRFFGKSWSEWELNGLVQRHLAGRRDVIIPIWHGVDVDDVRAYSPSLADIFAIPSTVGLDEVTARLLKIIQPEESALVTARNLIIGHSHEPPVISDDWWLDVIELSRDQDGNRWFFPVWRMCVNPESRGENLGWLVLQHMWQEAVETRSISQMSSPKETLEFIRSQPGLLDVCLRMPDRLLAFAPQLAIKGFGGELEGAIENSYRASMRMRSAARWGGDEFGSKLTKIGVTPACDEEFSLRHRTFGYYEPASVACMFVQGAGGGLGPNCRAFPPIEHAVWLLSKQSEWLPRDRHSYLLQGMKDWAVWPWPENDRNSQYTHADAGALADLLATSANAKRKKEFRFTRAAMADLEARVAHARGILFLPEEAQQLTQRFLQEGFVESWFAAQSRRSGRQRRRKQTSKK